MRNRLAPLLWSAHRLVRAVRPAPAGSFRILLFHDVAETDLPAFAALLAHLADSRRLIGPAEAEAMLAGNAWNGGRLPCLLSFDDGFASNRVLADTLLAEYGARALFFVCPGLMALDHDRQRQAIVANIHDGKGAADDRSLMGWDDLEHLRAHGHVIGNHTMDHLRLTRLTPAQQAEQVGEAARILSSRLEATDWFAYTFGDIDSVDASALSEIARHHRFCRSGIRGANHRAVHPLALRADHVDLASPPAWRSLAAEGGLDPLYRHQRARLDAMAYTAQYSPTSV